MSIRPDVPPGNSANGLFLCDNMHRTGNTGPVLRDIDVRKGLLSEQLQFTDPPCPDFTHVDYRLLRRLMNHYHCYFKGGTGGAGGSGYGNGVGGAGGDGIGPILNGDIHGDVINHHGQSGIHILHRSVALAAIYDSMESFPQPKCHPATRTRILKGLREWVLGDTDADFETFRWLHARGNPRCSIVWLYGPAGAGKSAVMQTLCGQLDAAGRLGGSFFFKCGHATRSNAKTLFATIAYQLALHVLWLRTPISEIVEHDPSIAVRTLAVQMRKLILEPCREDENGDTVTILIDGLDECEGLDIQVEILRIIRYSFSQGPTPLRFIIASRPEAHIHEMFDSPIYAGHHCSVNLVQSFDDVRQYLHDEFSRIHREHRTMANIPWPWPSWDILEQLVNNSSGHFIYASTIIKFIDDKSYRPTERLAMVQYPESSDSESAFDTLDQLYITILGSAARQSELIPILCAIVNFQLGAGQIDQLFGLEEGETWLLLRGLHSVLSVPKHDEDTIVSHHASFVDFLNNPDRSGNFCVGILSCRISLARSLLQYYAGPFRRYRVSALSNLIRFVVLLPPGALAELFTLLGSLNPDYILDPKEYKSRYHDSKSIVAWLKNSPSAPADVIQLWEDYAFILSIDKMPWSAEGLSVKQNVSPSLELLPILLSMGFLRLPLWELPITLDLTWTDLRATLCSLRLKLAGNEHVLPVHRLQTALHSVARDLALNLIRKMVKNHIDTAGGLNPAASRHVVLLYKHNLSMDNLKEAYRKSQYYLGRDIAYLVRLSPACPVLYRELWYIPPSEIWSSLPSGNTLIHHVSKWLESFPDLTMELITFWQQAVPDPELCREGLFSASTEFLEKNWCQYVRHYNFLIAGLNLPDNLKIIL
ncbi:NACHT domain-containing protein [Mycena sanguinolenta]|uniref:NACHT domain-containing protein n=1 Tax=Mycena sanguinolenta TaxID=230812 RepID=A0A8H6Z941_9AGAR|nr:NACHT domain-containing protein [Mycena sanguinolenta]